MSKCEKGIKNNWVERSRGNSIGISLFIWIIRKTGILPAYFVLLFASTQYLLLDKKTKTILREFRSVAGLGCSCVDLFRHFYNFGMSLIDRYAFLLTGKQFFTFDTVNENLISDLVSTKKGVILLGAHIGNWEIAGNLLQDRLNAKVNFLMFDGQSEEVKSAVSRATENRLVNIIFVGNDSADTSIALVNALQKGEIVCLHGDRVFGEQRTVDVMFMGRKVSFPAGPFILSAATGAPVVPIFTVKTSMKHYSFFAEDPIIIGSCQRSERMKKISEAACEYALKLEAVVRKYPYQWFNYYHFWGDISETVS